MCECLEKPAAASSIYIDNPVKATAILHVDDDVSFLEITKQILEIKGKFEVEPASSVEEALQKMQQKKFEAVVSDYEMPNQNGLNFLKLLREQQNEIPFVLFTGKGREDVAIKALNLGSDAFIHKTGDPETVYGELTAAVLKAIEHKRSKKLLADSELKYRKLITELNQGMLIATGPEKKIVFANTAMEKITGYSQEELASLSDLEIQKMVHPDDLQNALNSFRGALSGNAISCFEFRMIRKDGSTLWFEVCPSRIDYNGMPCIQCVFMDITERKKAEEALADSEAKYRALINNADDAIVLTDLAGRHIYRNPAYFKSLGFEEGQAETDGFARVHPDDIGCLKEKMAQLLRTGSANSEYRVKHQNGSWVYRFAKSTLLYNHNHEPFAILAIIRDVTENKKAEQALKDSEQKYQLLNEKLNIIGAFARHDIRNKLAVINGNVYLAKKSVKDNPALMSKLDQINAASLNIVSILDFSKEYESLGSKAPTLIDVGKVVCNAVASFSDLKGIKIGNKCVDFNVLADDMLTTIFHNFIENTLKYGEKATQIQVSYKTNSDGTATIIYEDNGVGIDDEIRPKLFEKGVGKGSGYGLYLIKRACDLYGWTLKETGARNIGARFELGVPNSQKMVTGIEVAK